MTAAADVKRVNVDNNQYFAWIQVARDYDFTIILMYKIVFYFMNFTCLTFVLILFSFKE